MLSAVLLAASRSSRLGELTASWPLTKRVVDRFVAGDQLRAALAVVRTLVAQDLSVTIDHLGESVQSARAATANRDEYLRLVDGLAALDLGPRAELSVKLSAFGQAMPGGHDLALANVRAVVAAAASVETMVTLDMEDHTSVDSTLAILAALRADFPRTGAVLQAYLHRSEDDARTLATSGSRVRLVKGAYREPPAVAHQSRRAVDDAFIRCLAILMTGAGHPMIGSHDPRMIDVAQSLARRTGRDLNEFEFQLLYGIRPYEAERLRALGHAVRVYVPYGSDWYGYFMRRLAERPANLAFFVRANASRD